MVSTKRTYNKRCFRRDDTLRFDGKSLGTNMMQTTTEDLLFLLRKFGDDFSAESVVG